jgi:hypothetical protein
MKYYTEPRKRGIYNINERRRLTGLVTTCSRNSLLKHVIEKKIEGRGRSDRKMTSAATG